MLIVVPGRLGLAARYCGVVGVLCLREAARGSFLAVLVVVVQLKEVAGEVRILSRAAATPK